jgi:hypothetical protein
VVVGPTFFLRAKQYFHIAVNMDGWKSYGVSEKEPKLKSGWKKEEIF